MIEAAKFIIVTCSFKDLIGLTIENFHAVWNLHENF